MKYTVTAKQMDLTDDLRLYAEKKVGKIDRLFRSESEAFVTFSRERGRFTAEVTLKNNGMFYRVKETTGDPFASVDSAAREYGCEGNYVVGANIAGFLKVSNAMMAQGAV